MNAQNNENSVVVVGIRSGSIEIKLVWENSIFCFFGQVILCSDWNSDVVRGSWLATKCCNKCSETKQKCLTPQMVINLYASYCHNQIYENLWIVPVPFNPLLSSLKPHPHLSRLSFSASQAKYQSLWKHSLNNALLVTYVAYNHTLKAHRRTMKTGMTMNYVVWILWKLINVAAYAVCICPIHWNVIAIAFYGIAQYNFRWDSTQIYD